MAKLAKRQQIRIGITFGMFLIMPLIMGFFSPIMTIRTALAGVLSASIITIGLMFFMGLFTGRSWCGWLCPAGGAQDVISLIFTTKKSQNNLRIIKKIGLILQIAVIILGLFIINPNWKFDYFYGLSWSVSGMDWVFYYFMIFLFIGLPLLVGERSYCNHFCVISPVMNGGKRAGRLLGLKYKEVQLDNECIGCKLCNKSCPSGLNVFKEQALEDKKDNYDCISCQACVDACPKKSLSMKKR